MALYGYCRVSTDEQVAGTSLGDQQRILMAVGVPLENIFTDEGVSGGVELSKRPQGERLLAVLQPGDTIVAAKLDRAFRSLRDALSQIWNLQQEGKHVILCDISNSPVTEDGSAGIILKVMGLVADIERGAIKSRTSNGRKAKKAAGGHIGGYAPFGFRKEGEKKEAVLVSIPTEQAAIPQILQLRSEGKSVRTIAKTFQEKGFKISKTTVYRILNPESRKRRKPPLNKKKENQL